MRSGREKIVTSGALFFVIFGISKMRVRLKSREKFEVLKGPRLEESFDFFHPQWVPRYLSSLSVSEEGISQGAALARKLSEEAVGYISRLSRRSM